MATWTLIHDEDWSSYGTDIDAVSNNSGPDYGAYTHPDQIGSNLSGHSTTVGPTAGPDGGPGCSDLAGSHGVVYKHPLEFPCGGVRVQVRKDFTGWTPSIGNLSSIITEGWWGVSDTPGEYDGSTVLWSVVVTHQSSGNHGLIVTAERMTGSDYNSGSLFVVPRDAACTILVEMVPSTISGTFGSYSAAADGYVKVWIDDVLVHDTGAIEIAYGTTDVLNWNGDPIDNNPDPYQNTIECGLAGLTGEWKIWADTSCELSETRNNLLTGQTHRGRLIKNSVIAGEGGTLDTKERVVLLALANAFEWDGENGCLVLVGNLHIINGSIIYHGGTLATGGSRVQMDPTAGAFALTGLEPTVSGGPSAGAPTAGTTTLTGLSPSLLYGTKALPSTRVVTMQGHAPTVT